jgi:hypothetical protein
MLKNEPFGVESRKHILPVTTNELRLYCLAPARLHRRANKVLHEWGEVQQEVDYLDSAMLASVKITGEATRTFANRFGSWVLDRAMGLMVRQLLLGFQLDLYAEQEYVAVYWYCDRITQMRIQNRSAARKAYFERELGAQPDFSGDGSGSSGQVSSKSNGDDGFGAEVLMASSGGKGNKKNKNKKKSKKGKSKKKGKKSKNKLQTSVTAKGGASNVGTKTDAVIRLSLDATRHDSHIHYRALTELDMHRTLYRSYACALIVLRHFGYLDCSQTYALGSDALRFQHRFQQFQHFNQPSPIQYQEFETHIDTVKEKGEQILAMVKGWFSHATQQSKILLARCPCATNELRARVRKIAKVCVINGIILQTLMKDVSVKKPDSMPPSMACAISFEFVGKDSNSYFPIIREVPRE